MSPRLAQFVQGHARAMVVLVLTFALAGIAFIFKLPISIFPQTDFPRIIILVDNGITPVDIQMLQVTRPIEEAIRMVPGITDVRSTTARGSTEISVFFRWNVDIVSALQLVRRTHLPNHPLASTHRAVLHQSHDFLGVPDARLQHHLAHPVAFRSVATRLLRSGRRGCTGCRASPKPASSAGASRSTTSWWIPES